MFKKNILMYKKTAKEYDSFQKYIREINNQLK